MKALAVCISIAVMSLFAACDGQNQLLPKSGGRPFEALVVSTGSNEAAQILAEALSADVEGLPQPEPLFDVSTTDNARFNQMAKMARSIVIVTVDSTLFTSVRIRYEKNVWAQPQMVAYVNAPSVQSLHEAMPEAGKQVASLLERAETNTEISRLAASHNKAASATVKKELSCDIHIPTEMKSSKSGKGFTWFSDNGAATMGNICVYTYPGTSLDAARVVEARDSVMRENIPGEHEGTHMQTVRETVKSGITQENGRTLMRSCGLWQMHGDAMGGPFVSHSTIDTANSRVIVAEAFVYAPGRKKRNLIKKLEAALYTLK